jgi:CO/xanthine dehydrogenase FAD-binding subunit
MLQYCRQHPSAVVHAGGTYLNRDQQRGNLVYPSGVIFIHQIEELKKISRTERYIEIGAGASLNSMIDIGFSNLPRCLSAALEQIGTRTVRNCATVGGNLCVPDRRMDLFPVLGLMNVRVELRKLGGSRWIQLGRLFDEDNVPIREPGEVLTRLRIPFDQWEKETFQKVGSSQIYPSQNLVFCGLAKVQKGLLQEIRFAFSGIKHLFFRDKSIESDMAGKKLPLLDKIREGVEAGLERRITGSEVELSDVHRIHMHRLLNGFLDSLSLEY